MKFEAEHEDDLLKAIIRETNDHHFRLKIYLSRWGRDDDLIHIETFNTFPEAESRMRTLFADVHWR